MNTETAFHKLEEILEGIRRGRDIMGRGRKEDCKNPGTERGILCGSLR